MRFSLEADFDSNSQFNQWIDERYAETQSQLEILSFKPRPSEVLFLMSHSTYVTAFSDFISTFDEDLKRSITDAFPLPIAYYFYRFENGYENDLQRLHLLRDVWETTVDVLHALAIGEARFRVLNLNGFLKFSDILSDSIAARLSNIERIVNVASAQGLQLLVQTIVSPSALTKMRNLNQSRNAFSHSAAQSEAQARKWIDECYEDVLDILDEIRKIDDCNFFRYLGQVDGNTLRGEIFRGHGFTRTIQNIQLTDDQVNESRKYFRVGQILVYCDRNLFSVIPHIFFQEDSEGHMTKPCMFRRTYGDGANRCIEFAVVGNAAPISMNRSLFTAELNELRALFGLAPE